jgi:hypothetical protein
MRVAVGASTLISGVDYAIGQRIELVGRRIGRAARISSSRAAA